MYYLHYKRAVITSIDGRANFERALPDSRDRTQFEPALDITKSEDEVLSDKDLRELERNNIVRALEKSGWKVAGKDGAASILGIPTSTLNSKIKAFGIEMPSN